LANPSDEFINFYVKYLNIEYKPNDSIFFKISNENENEMKLIKVQ
jgi:hypothetical protein